MQWSQACEPHLRVALVLRSLQSTQTSFPGLKVHFLRERTSMELGRQEGGSRSQRSQLTGCKEQQQNIIYEILKEYIKYLGFVDFFCLILLVYYDFQLCVCLCFFSFFKFLFVFVCFIICLLFSKEREKKMAWRHAGGWGGDGRRCGRGNHDQNIARIFNKNKIK